MMKTKAKQYLSIVVYRSLKQAWNTLTAPELKGSPQVKSLIDACQKAGIVQMQNGEIVPLEAENQQTKSKSSPFIVVEGLDGTGKTTLSNYVSTSLNMTKMGTPPNVDAFQNTRSFFETQPETVKRAYYSVGNYLAAKNVMDHDKSVVMDRFWHSTCASALAHVLKNEGGLVDKSDFIWPTDLLQPNLVIFLTVSEEERILRHTSRRNFTNTEEEKILANDSMFRRNLVDCFRQIEGPPFVELEVNGAVQDSKQKILKCVKERFPDLV